MPFDAIIAGLDASGAPAACLLGNHRLHGLAPYVPLPIKRAVFLPPIDDIQDDLEAHVDERPHQALHETLMHQRTVKIGHHYAIGGRAVRTRIDRSGISQTVIGAWQDVKGERIDPARPFVPTRTVGKAARPPEQVNNWGGFTIDGRRRA